MRIKTIEQLEACMNAKAVYVTVIPDSIEELPEKEMTACDMRKLMEVYPCRLSRTDKKDSGGYLLSQGGSKGISFDSAASTSYELEVLSPKAMKKAGISPDKYLACGGHRWFNAAAVHYGVSVSDGRTYKAYIENSMDDGDGRASDDGVVETHFNRIWVFTELWEAERRVVDRVDALADEMITEINHRAESMKAGYYRLKYSLER